MLKEVTAGIKVCVETFYQPSHSNPTQSQHVFSYKITIENYSANVVQLKRRHWHIIDSNGIKREVEGEGVVGEQPVIEPGKSYQYISGCNLNSEMGKMRGTYLLERKNDGITFEVNIPEFIMIVPYKMN